jgi:hypothetical protein
VPSIIANSSPTAQPVIARSRSNADGEEPSLSPPVAPPIDDTNRAAIRLPADGLGNPSTTNTGVWRTSDNHAERQLISWSSDDDDDDDDDDEVPLASRLRPVLIGGEDNPQVTHSNDDDTILTNLSLNTSN